MGSGNDRLSSLLEAWQQNVASKVSEYEREKMPAHFTMIGLLYKAGLLTYNFQNCFDSDTQIHLDSKVQRFMVPKNAQKVL